MPEPRLALLRQRLLDGGIAPRRARRLLRELRAHFADLQAEQQRTGLPESAAAQAALQRLGTEESLAEQMLARPELRSWSCRWPWAVYALLYRWLPTVVAAGAVCAGALLRRAMQRRALASEDDMGGTDGGGGHAATGSGAAISK